jgi:hypothetical protein
LLTTYSPSGTPVSLAPAVLASLEQTRRCPEGFTADDTLRHWVRQTQRVEVQDHRLDTWVRMRFHATINVARPSHAKNA